MLCRQFSNRIECSLESYWHYALTEDYNRDLYEDFLKYRDYRLLHEEDTGDRVHRKIQYAPPPPPGGIARVAGRFRSSLLTEVLVFDKATQCASIDYVPDAFTSLVQIHATISCIPVEAGIERVADCEMSLKVPLIGARAERSLAAFLEDQAAKHAHFAEAYLGRVTTSP
jgi:hypothetical protein